MRNHTSKRLGTKRKKRFYWSTFELKKISNFLFVPDSHVNDSHSRSIPHSRAAIAAVYSLVVGIYYIKAAHSNNVKQRTKAQIERRKKNKCLLFINAYETSIYISSCDAY